MKSSPKLSISFKTTFMIRLSPYFHRLAIFKFVEREIRRETRIKIVKANNLIKKHNNRIKLQVDEILFLHSSMPKIEIFFHNLNQKYILIFYMPKCSLINLKKNIKLLNLFEYCGSCPNSIVH